MVGGRYPAPGDSSMHVKHPTPLANIRRVLFSFFLDPHLALFPTHLPAYVVLGIT